MRVHRTFDQVDGDLKNIMKDIWVQISGAAEDYNLGPNYVAGANIAGFEKVVRAMREQGMV